MGAQACPTRFKLFAAMSTLLRSIVQQQYNLLVVLYGTVLYFFNYYKLFVQFANTKQKVELHIMPNINNMIIIITIYK